MHAARPFAFVLIAIAAPVVAQGGWVQRLSLHTPPPRGWHGLDFDVQRGVHVLFGGTDGAGGVYGDTWEWNGIDWLQRALVPAPPARQAHAMAYDFNRGRIVMTGGRGAAGLFVSDTWEFDGAVWVQRSPLQSPSPREVAGMAFSSARGRVILFGGEDGSVLLPLQDTWEWDGSNWTPIATANAPPARYAFGMTSDFAGGRVLVFGGHDGVFDLSDAWAFDGVDWSPLPATQTPAPRTNTTLVADLTRGMVVQFGGLTYSGNGIPTNETWLHDGSDWRRDARPTAITPRRAFALSYDWQRDRAVLFGGLNSGTFSETWEYDLAGVALWSVVGAGCAGTQGVPQLRPAGPQRAILGTSFRLAVTGGVTGGALFALGFSNASWNGNALPLSLAGFGMPGCQLHTAVDVSFFAAAVAGTAQFVLAVPNSPGLVGVRFFAQALVPQAGVNPLGAVASNAVATVVGSF